MEPREEDDLRRLIRRELESRERKPDGQASLSRSPDLSAERRRIIEDEIERYYRSRGDYIRFENEDGEVEWLTEAQIREREGQIPVDMEELEEGQRRVRNRMLGLVGLAFLAVVLLILLMRNRTGTIQVISNVKGATVLLNGSATEFTTDARLERVTVGPHVIAVSKSGYVPDGTPSTKIQLKAGRTEVVVLNLKPDSTVDTFGRPR